ncbi:hypothetical protein [uncultured Eubacterium sp.]|uniref:hypothetical protein n=1 Tax=uncultured Eubacterium sp. TaxID=165185 RepID=UPI0015BB94F6|nr:hypothetical protein [uncultured Eubacterium sp.]
MENKEKKQHKLIPGSKVRVSTVAIISVVLAVLLAISSFGLAVFSADVFEEKDGYTNVFKWQSKLYTKAVVAVMPKKITGNDAGRMIDFYIEENEDFDINKDEPVQQFRVYYYKDGEKLVAKNGVYVGQVNTMYPLVGFFIQGKDNLKALKGVCITLVAVVFLAILALIIWLIYLVVSIKQSRKYSASYQEQLAEKKAEKARKKQEKE